MTARQSEGVDQIEIGNHVKLPWHRVVGFRRNALADLLDVARERLRLRIRRSFGVPVLRGQFIPDANLLVIGLEICLSRWALSK